MFSKLVKVASSRQLRMLGVESGRNSGLGTLGSNGLLHGTL